MPSRSIRYLQVLLHMMLAPTTFPENVLEEAVGDEAEVRAEPRQGVMITER